jgi:hypothetical protein
MKLINITEGSQETERATNQENGEKSNADDAKGNGIQLTGESFTTTTRHSATHVLAVDQLIKESTIDLI